MTTIDFHFSAFDLPLLRFRPSTMDHRMLTMDYRLSTFHFGLWSIIRILSNSLNNGLRTVNSILSNSLNCRLSTLYYGLTTLDFPLST